jgi:FkbM family methyltransferase
MSNPLTSGVRALLGPRRIRRIKARRIVLAERIGISRWSRPGLGGLDVRLAQALGNASNGTFMELGANDGLQQSNTYMLEREYGWSGVLIEASPPLAAECAANRPDAKVVCAVLNSAALAGVPLAVTDRDLMGIVGPGRVMAASTTLSLIIEHVLSGHPPDLISIDVEGFELQVLAGLDLERHSPRWILVETSTPEAVRDVLRASYEDPVSLSFHDYLYERKSDLVVPATD